MPAEWQTSTFFFPFLVDVFCFVSSQQWAVPISYAQTIAVNSNKPVENSIGICIPPPLPQLLEHHPNLKVRLRRSSAVCLDGITIAGCTIFFWKKDGGGKDILTS